MDVAKKNFRRFQQRANQNLGLSEKTDVVGADAHKVEEKVDAFIDVLVRLKQKFVECQRSKSKEENVEKRRKKLNEFQLGTAFVNDAKFMEEDSFDGLFSDLLKLFGISLLNISDEIAQSELNIEKRVFEPLSRLAEDHKNVQQLKDKLKNAVLDMDSARSRLNNAPSEKMDQLQVELDSAWNKVDNLKDNWMTEMYSLAAKELDVANLILLSAKIQLEYFKSACHNLEAVLPAMQEKVDQYSKRPVFGCPLSDHLRYSHREISLVLEVCCSALLELGVREEGLFRLSGSASKIKKLKAMFDIDELDLSDWDALPHSIAGTLKLYLRELPEPLMTYQLYNEWIKAAEEKETESRLKNLKSVCERLPESNFKNLRYLFRFLARVVENQQFTKMNCHNLAIVMAPNLLRSPCTSVDEGFRDNAAITNVVDCLISNVDYFFPGDVKFACSKLTGLFNRTGGFSDDTGSMSSINRMDDSTRSISPPVEDPIVAGQKSPASIQSSSLSRRPKQPAPPPPAADQKRPTSLKGALNNSNTSLNDPITCASSTCSIISGPKSPPAIVPVQNNLQTAAAVPERMHKKSNSLKGNEISKNEQLTLSKRTVADPETPSNAVPQCSNASVLVNHHHHHEKSVPQCSLPGRPPIPDRDKVVDRRSSSGATISKVTSAIVKPVGNLVTTLRIGEPDDPVDKNKKNMDHISDSSMDTVVVARSSQNRKLPAVAPRLSMKKMIARLEDDFEDQSDKNNNENCQNSSENAENHHTPPPRPKPPVPVKPSNGGGAVQRQSSINNEESPSVSSTRL